MMHAHIAHDAWSYNTSSRPHPPGPTLHMSPIMNRLAWKVMCLLMTLFWHSSLRVHSSGNQPPTCRCMQAPYVNIVLEVQKITFLNKIRWSKNAYRGAGLSIPLISNEWVFMHFPSVRIKFALFANLLCIVCVRLRIHMVWDKSSIHQMVKQTWRIRNRLWSKSMPWERSSLITSLAVAFLSLIL